MVQATLYLLHYNNYHNKIVKREDTILDYINLDANLKDGDPKTVLGVIQGINFIPNDGISTEQIINWQSEDPDYVIVVDEQGVIQSRWFVMENQRLRRGQHRLALYRDVMADFYEEIKNSTCFVQKGWTNESPLVFNNEDMGFNQIKKDEIKLQNTIKSPWLVLYLARYNNDGQYNRFQGSFADQPTTVNADYEFDSLSQYPFAKYSNYTGHTAQRYVWADFDNARFAAEYVDQNNLEEYLRGLIWIASVSRTGFIPRDNGKEAVNLTDVPSNYPILRSGRSFSTEIGAGKYKQAFGTFLGDLNSGNYLDGGLMLNSYTANPTQIGEIWPGPSYIGNNGGDRTLYAENNKTIKIGNDLYRITYTSGDAPGRTQGAYKIPKDSSLGQDMWGEFFLTNSEEGNVVISQYSNQNYYLILDTTNRESYLTITKVGSAIDNSPIEYDIQYDTSHTRDASYEIIAAPYEDVSWVNVPSPDGSATRIDFTNSGDICLQWFQNIINKYHSAGFAYDLQLVPYCPFDTFNTFNMAKLDNDDLIWCYRTPTDSSNKSYLSCAIKLDTSSFSYRIYPTNIPIRDDLKLSNELDLYRLVSPNGVGEYEWSPAKNGGSVNMFEVDCTLIPFQPYIKVNPYFTNLYGSDWDDYRGLICGGDFSLPIISSEWETYKLNNKYYQDIFDRNIEHQEYNNKYQRISDITGAITGTAGGATTGAVVGSAFGPLGTAIGAVAGGMTSAAGGITDVVINEKLRRENINYQKDQFGYELGTIKARSQSLTRSTSFNVNNKYFPYVEYYSCTETEEKALIAKMKYDGMTIGVIGTISDYMNPSDYTYIQAKLIEIDIPEDYHFASEIDNVLQGGIRIA